MGDRAVSEYGVIAVPDVKEYSITPNDMFVVLASDGIWSMLENNEVSQLVYKNLKQDRPLEFITNSLINHCKKTWDEECEDDYVG